MLKWLAATCIGSILIVRTMLHLKIPPMNGSDVAVHSVASKNDEAIALLRTAFEQRRSSPFLEQWRPTFHLSLTHFRILSRKFGAWTVYQSEQSVRFIGRTTDRDLVSELEADEYSGDRKILILLPTLITSLFFIATTTLLRWVVEITFGRVARRYALNFIASSALGDDFQSEKVQGVSERPFIDETYVKRIELSDNLERRLLNEASLDFTKNFQSAYAELNQLQENPSVLLKTLSGFRSVHSLYYTHEEIIKIIAETISSDS
ncbi:hypothetical protein [Phaeobacter italicus]|uniref:hypothetical protein n=1 Tax=Phaeobacter italicus TaxID=481446 RepID=UPI001CD632B3|nr:hypothetical protein [Phaeobacter italicus]MCA0858820.1 hypothetical protein [Phaeobacter italicus]